MNKLFSLIFSLFILSSCGQTDEDSKNFEGKRYLVEYWRWDYLETYSLITGTHEWWFYKSGVFRQIGDNYVEVYGYGDSQACSGTATGTFKIVEKNDNVYKVDLSYEGVDLKNVKGLCRMTNRQIIITVQPSGAVDIWDNTKVQRLKILQDI